MWATYNFQDIAIEWWNAYNVEHGVQYLKLLEFMEVFWKIFIP